MTCEWWTKKGIACGKSAYYRVTSRKDASLYLCTLHFGARLHETAASHRRVTITRTGTDPANFCDIYKEVTED